MNCLEACSRRPFVICGTEVTEVALSKWLLQNLTHANYFLGFADDKPISTIRSVVGNVPIYPVSEIVNRDGIFTDVLALVPPVRQGCHPAAFLLEDHGWRHDVDFFSYPELPDYVIDWAGPYDSWDQTKPDCGGYEDAAIIAAAVEHKMHLESLGRSGCFVPEQSDCRLFFPFIQIISAIRNNCMQIVDFGGALGQHYDRFRELFKGKLRWTIWETPAFANAGTKHFMTEELSFTSNVETIGHDVDVVVASGVLQCVDDMREYWRRIVSLKPRFILLDRLPLFNEKKDRLYVQRVHRTTSQRYFNAAYPGWFLAKEKWLSIFQQEFDIVMAWNDPQDAIDPSIGGGVYSGLLLKAKSLLI